MPFAAVSAIAINVVAMNRPAMQGGFRSAIAAHLPDHDTLPPHRGYVEFLKAAASAVSRVGAITDPSSMLGLPIRYTNQSSVSAGSPMSEF
jgi:hypothetical protein